MSTTSAPVFRQVPTDARQIVPFIKLSENALPSLNRDIGTTLSPAAFVRLKSYFADVEKRNPTIGEVRMFCRLDALTRKSPVRIAPGTMETPSAPLAAAWADAMARRHALEPAHTAPAALTELASLTDRWLSRTGENRATRLRAPDGASLAQAAASAAAGRLTPAARLYAPDGSVRLFCAPSAAPAVPTLEGDLILHLTDVTPEALNALMQAGGKTPLVCALVPLGRGPMLLSLPALCPGASIRAERLLPVPEGDPAEPASYADPIPALCAVGTAPSGKGVDALARVRAARADEVSRFFEENGITARLIGEASAREKLTVTLAGCAVINVGTALLRAATAPVLTAFRPPMQTLPASPSVSRVPLFAESVNADTSAAPHLLPLTARPGADSRVMPGAGLRVSAAETTLADPAEAYVRAENALLAALAGVISAGADRMSVSAAVTVTVPQAGHAGGTDDAPEPAWDTAFAALCGLYRAACELSLPLTEPRLTVAAPSGEGRLSVCAMAPEAVGRERAPILHTPGRRLFLCIPAPAENADEEPTNWAEVRTLLDALDALPDGCARLPLIDDGRTPLDRLTTAAGAVSICPDPAALSALRTPVRFGFLVEADPGVTVGGLPVGETVGAQTEVSGTEAPAAGSPDAGQLDAGSPDAGPLTAGRLAAGRLAAGRLAALLPVMRREAEPTVRAAAARLTGLGYDCVIQPVAPERLPVSIITPAQDGYGPLFSPTLTAAVNAASAASLIAAVREADLVVLAMRPSELSLLFAHAGIREALLSADRPSPPAPGALTDGVSLLLLGRSCLCLDADELLPSGLPRPDTAPVHSGTPVVPVSDGTPDGYLRLCREPLLSPEGGVPENARCVLHVPAAVTVDVPDGFVTPDGRVMVLLYGLPGAD